jgi:hypothetical protein
MDKILVLPGFEFTATFGFHVLGIFAPDTPIRYIEHVLMSLNVPHDVVDRGDPAAGSTADVLDCYHMVHEAGGVAIAAHINSAHGVMMRGLNFGGQTRIAYTQDRHLHALEITDMNRRGRQNTRRFFDGTKPEYPRRMHIIQSSDAHSLDTYQEGKNTRYGVGERVTEMLLKERSFEAIKELFESTDFSRTRPYNPDRTPYDYIMAAREEGPSLVQAFHESMERKGGKMHAVVADVCAFANTNGGMIYVGLSENKNKPPKSIPRVNEAIKTLQDEISRTLTPALNVEIDAQETQGATIVRIIVPYGEDRPYAINDNNIYIRDEAETSLAVRDEIVNLVKQGMVFNKPDSNVLPDTSYNVASVVSNDADTLNDPSAEDSLLASGVPRAGVEIVAVEERNNTRYYTMCDLRNGNIVKNVTLSSARRLWHYAIKQYEGNPVKLNKVQWHENFGLWRRYQKAGTTRYDLVMRPSNGRKDAVRIFYGVTDNGMHDHWETFLADDE